jgi:hypothetical protein
VLDEVAGHLGCGGDDGVAESPEAGRPERTGHDAGGHRVAAADRGRGQQELVYQGAPWCQLSWRRLEILLRGVMVAGRERHLSQQESPAGRGQAARQLGRGAQITQR